MEVDSERTANRKECASLVMESTIIKRVKPVKNQVASVSLPTAGAQNMHFPRAKTWSSRRRTTGRREKGDRSKTEATTDVESAVEREKRNKAPSTPIKTASTDRTKYHFPTKRRILPLNQRRANRMLTCCNRLSKCLGKLGSYNPSKKPTMETSLWR